MTATVPGGSEPGQPPELDAAGEPVQGGGKDAAPKEQPRNPLHGLTLEAIVTALVDHYGWDGLGERIPVRCFNVDPSVGSSLRFLRKTPWAREKVEGLYLFMLREERRAGRG
ncbi:VF530 family protein [Hydrogenophaga sp.]|uniref:VF530 family protein n=1 Tax=Hydrogenophaga sp. TaxID=1904254 RepID=UPI00271D7B01|nr:VF530 family protein [Hydrogenophaga sp.]MDO9436652.1 VF530 family protein [Hydrogenophaga sp.]